MYAIIKTGGKQYRADEGAELLVERLPGEVGDKVQFQPLLVRNEDQVLYGGKGKVDAVIVDQPRGPKVQSFKYNPKKGYKRMIGHRQELTKIRIEKISLPRTRRSKEEKEEKQEKIESEVTQSGA